MPKIKVYTATRADGAMLAFSHPVEEEWTVEDVARQLLEQAQRSQDLIPDGRRGATRVERLAEYGFAITSVEEMEAPAEDAE
ncbi:hypothetical protein [Paracidovorax oryzae]|uniref:hypothetical protein n=1 Tax=Paracidovorax oryzae TaxID=862720 RepID=UPI00030CB55A|nr:hypothetical protein [Paracidovorax oryzae]